MDVQPAGPNEVALGLDQSLTSTGWYIMAPGYEDHGTISTSREKDNPLDSYTRVLFMADAIRDLIMEHKVDVLVIEGLGFGAKGNATRDLAGLQYHIICSVLRMPRKVRIAVIPPTTLKKFATDNGRANKEDMFDALPDMTKEVIKKYPKSRGRYDVTDAFYLSILGKLGNYKQKAKEALEKEAVE